MTVFPIDQAKWNPRALGVVRPSPEWEDGKRTGRQAVTPDGVPVWEIKVAGDAISYGEEDVDAAFVRIAAKTKPEFKFGQPLRFTDLTGSGSKVYINAGSLVDEASDEPTFDMFNGDQDGKA